MSGLLGVILAGGEGRRMGGPKEGVPVPGGTLLSQAWNALAPVSSRLILQGAAQAPPGLEASRDLRPGEGPLAGLESALARAGSDGAEGVALLAVDLPRVTAPVVLDLARRWRSLPDPSSSAVAVDTRRGPQPLVGIYGVGLAEALSRWLDAGGDRAARGWVDSLGERVVTVPEVELVEVAGHPEPFLNVNRPGHVERALDLPPPAPPLVSVTGWKDSGKTSVAVALVGELRRRGYRVMALKHGHQFRLDTPGTDSYRLTHESGAERVLLAGPENMALLGGWSGGGESGVFRLAARYLHEADVVVVEGWKREPLPAVEVYHCTSEVRPALWSPLAPDRDRILARVLRECPESRERPLHGPRELDAADPSLAARLADLVESRVIPGSRWFRNGGDDG